MEILETEFKSVIGTVITPLSLGTLYTHKNSKVGILQDAVSEKTYQFPLQSLRRIVGSLKVLFDCKCHVQRHYSIEENTAVYVPMDRTSFLFGKLEFDWEDLIKIDKVINNHG